MIEKISSNPHKTKEVGLHELTEEKLSAILPGWEIKACLIDEIVDLEKSIDQWKLKREKQWTLTKKMEDGSEVQLVFDTAQKSVSFLDSKTTLILRDIQKIIFNFGTKELVFKGKTGRYSVINAKRHRLVTKDKKLIFSRST